MTRQNILLILFIFCLTIPTYGQSKFMFGAELSTMQNFYKKTNNENSQGLYRNVNSLISQFSNVSLGVKCSLFKSFCMSVYGSQLWNFESKTCNNFYTAWRKCIRRLLGLHIRTHSNLLNLVCKDVPVEYQLHIRFISYSLMPS